MVVLVECCGVGGGVCSIVAMMVVVLVATPPGMVESARISVSVNL